MSFYKTVTLWCDGVTGVLCLAGFIPQSSAVTVAEARLSARSEGWGRRGRRDLCPECVTRQARLDSENA